MDSQNLNIVILAAGAGTRMHSQTPKVLHELSGKPILQHVIETALKSNPARLIIVYGHGGELVKSTINNICPHVDIIWVKQEEQLGTGHALKEALPNITANGKTLILYGDAPLISPHTLDVMAKQHNNNIIILTAILQDPYGYGRIIRDTHQHISMIVEEKDATSIQKEIREVNSGVYIFPNQMLPEWLNSISNNNAQNEYYLTDVIKIAHTEGVEIQSVTAHHEYEIFGINNKTQLESLERICNHINVGVLLEKGVTIKDKSRVEIRGDVTMGQDCVIDVNCVFEGRVIIGNNVIINAGCILKNVTIKDNVNIKPYSVIEGAVIEDNCQIGPFARIRPETVLQADAHIGNFVEVKKSMVGANSKINHLTYIGDSQIGAHVNVGAGSVTCNYDGTNKHQTIIEDDAFIGSGTMMVAPVTIGTGAIIGAGSVITKNAPADELTLTRARQTTIIGWKKKQR